MSVRERWRATPDGRIPGVNPALAARSDLAHAHRVVVKVGSSSLTGADGRLDIAALRDLVDALAARRARGGQEIGRAHV